MELKEKKKDKNIKNKQENEFRENLKIQCVY